MAPCASPTAPLLALAACLLAASAPCRAQPADPFAPDASLTITLPINPPPRAPRLSERALLEMGAVVLTGAGHLVASAHDASGLYIPIVVGSWGSYVGYRAMTEPGFLREAGFTSERLGPAFRDATLVAAGALAGMAVVGAAQGTLRLHADVLPLLVLYPAWGLTQQFLVQGLVTRHLYDAGLTPYIVVPASAATFGAVHLPDLKLTAATTALGGAYAALYLRHGNLWPLGLYHGVLGAAFYVWVLDRNPWQELVGGEDTP